MSDPLSKFVKDVIGLQEEVLGANGHHPHTKPFLDDLSEPAKQEAARKALVTPTIEALMEGVPTRVRLSRQLLKSYLGTASNRAKLFKSMEQPVKMLLGYSEVTPRMAEYYISLITDVLLHCDGTEVFNRELLESNIRELSKHVANPEFGDGIEASSDEIPVPTIKGS